MNWDEIEERTILPGMHGRFVHTDRMSFALWRMEKGVILPRHSHMHEQVVFMQSGELDLFVDGVRMLLVPGTVLPIPANAPHWGTALTDVRVMDAFSPVREDYRDGGPNILAEAAAAG